MLTLIYAVSIQEPVFILSQIGGTMIYLGVKMNVEPLLLVPIFVSPMVMGFGYVVAMGDRKSVV